MAGLVPAIHDYGAAKNVECPGQARA